MVSRSSANGGSQPAIGGEAVTHGDNADDFVSLAEPYQVLVRIKGTAALLFHRYSVASVEEKSKAAKGSAIKKTDDVESFLYRCEDGHVGIDGRMIVACIREAGRSVPDPRSPRKSMRDLLTSILIPVDETSPLLPLTKVADFISQDRVVVQRAAVTRSRPAMHKGWELEFKLNVAAREYLPPALLRKLLVSAGLFQGLADWRPTYGRFDTIHFEEMALLP